MIKNKNGNFIYFGIFHYPRYKNGKFYTCFSSGVREVPRYEGSSIKNENVMTKEQFYRLPKAKKYVKE